MEWTRRLRYYLRRRQFEAELAEEMDHHRALSGVRQFGNVMRLKEESRAAWSWVFVERLCQDVHYALRTMRANWTFTLLATLSLAVGIGANTALFSVVNTVVLAELPLPDADEIVTFRWVGPNDVRLSGRNYGVTPPDPVAGQAGSEFSFAAFDRLRSVNETLTGLTAFAPAGSALTLTADGVTDPVIGQYVAGNYYSLLGVPVILGRAISPGDDLPDAPPVVVLSHEYWERRFQADAATIGRTILVNGLSFTVVGVGAPGTSDPSGMGRTAPAVSMPLAVEARLPKTNQTLLTRPAAWWLLMMGRLREGVTREQVQANFETVFQVAVRTDWEARRNATDAPTPPIAGEPQIPGLRVVDGAHGVYGVPQPALAGIGILGIVFVLVLGVVCVNLASLLLSRMNARHEELTVRRAIGASRGRLLRQLLTENALMAAIGGALGVGVAYWCLWALPGILPPLTRPDLVNQWDLVQIRWPVLAFAEAVALLTVLFFGLGPALRASRAPAALHVNARASASPRSALVRGLVAGQVGLSLVLLVAAGLFLRTLTNLRSVPVGFNPNNVLVFSIDPQVLGYDPQQARALYEQLLGELDAMPAVEAASYSGFAPLTGSNRSAMVFFPDSGRPTPVPTVNVHHDFFRTMGIPLIAGPGFVGQYATDSPRVAVVNEAFVRAFLGDGDPVGSRFGISSDAREAIEIVGVVADTNFRTLREPVGPIYYSPDSQGFGSSARTFEVRTVSDPEPLAASVFDIISRLDPRLPVFRMATYLDGIESTLVVERIFASATSFFGAMTLMLSMAGLFGLMSYTVSCRTREIGIRMALGAGRSAVLGAVLKEALLLTGAGVVLGLVGAVLVTPLIASFLYGLSPHDPLAIAAAVAVMLLVAALAGYLPARRASRLDPIESLRHE